MVRKVLSFILCMAPFIGNSQENKVNKLEEVNVKYNINPNLSEVFKIKTNPKIIDTIVKKEQQYNIKTTSISSDYIPAIKKFKYAELPNPKKEDFRSYAYGAIGTYANSEFIFKWNPEAYKKFVYGVDFENNSNQNGIKDKRVNNQHIVTKGGVFIGKQFNRNPWAVNAFYKRNQVNWYGLDANALVTDYQGKSVQQVYNDVNIFGQVELKSQYLKKIVPNIHFFNDQYGSNEVNLKLASDIELVVGKKTVNSNLSLQVVNGSLQNDYLNTANLNHNVINVVYKGGFIYQIKNWTTNIQASVIINADKEQSETKFYLLPNIQSNVRIIQNVMNLNMGIRSNFNQNTYQQLTEQNSYISPTILLKPTVTLADLYVGIDGKLSADWNYCLESSYAIEKNKLLFVRNELLPTIVQPYQLGNTFKTTYDKVNTLHLKGMIDVKMDEHWKLGTLASVNFYNATNKAWNLPNFTTEAYMVYLYQKWSANAGINLNGIRYDLIQNIPTRLNPYVDVNLKGKYAFTDNFYAHINLYNLLSNQYERYINYQIQGLQVLAGLTYKF